MKSGTGLSGSARGADAARKTINHVAAAAGVSIKTVSRVLNQEASVTEETRERVNAAMTALNYTPNISARRLAGTRSYLLGILFDNPVADYVTNLQRGALDQCRDAGYHVLVDWLDSEAPDFERRLHAALANVRTDGVILSPPLCDNLLVLETLDAHDIPYVRIAPYRAIDRGPYINIDDAGAAFEMTCLLLDLGHERIAFIKGHPDHGATHLRYGGYTSALRARHISLHQSYVRQGDFTPASGISAAEDLLSQPDRPTAIFASNDEMALGVMLTAAKLGLRVPQDLSVCGFDDMPAARLVWPQLTTVRQPIAEMSRKAAELLIRREANAQGYMLDFKIVVRGSTGPVAQ